MLVYFASLFITSTRFLCPADLVNKNKWTAFVNYVHFSVFCNWAITLCETVVSSGR